MLSLFWTSRAGPVISPDSIVYLSAARSLVRTGTLKAPSMLEWEIPADTIPYAGFPPGYPALIAVPLALEVPPIKSARIVQAVSAFITVSVAVLLAATFGSPAIGILAAAMILLTPAFVTSHMAVLSEPAFFAAFLLTLLAMVCFPGRPILAGMASGAALALRFAGVGATLAGVVWTVCRPGTWSERLRRASIASAPSAIVLAAWAVRTRIVSGRAHGGESDFIGDPFPMLLAGGLGRSSWKGFGFTLWDGVDAVFDWLIPLVGVYLTDWRYRAVILAFVLVTIAGMFFQVYHRHNEPARGRLVSEEQRSQFWIACGVMAGSYLLVILLARIFADPWLTFEARILSPVMLIGVLVFVTILGAWWPRRAVLLRGTVAAGIGIWFLLAIGLNARVVPRALRDGVDASGNASKRSPTVLWTRDNGKSRAVFTNDPASILWNTEADARVLPLRVGASWRDPYPQPLDTSVAITFGDTLVRRNGVIVAFDENNAYMMSPDSLARLLALRQIARFPDGTVWAPGAETVRVLERLRGMRMR